MVAIFKYRANIADFQDIELSGFLMWHLIRSEYTWTLGINSPPTQEYFCNKIFLFEKYSLIISF